jgi:hypothetical protein
MKKLFVSLLMLLLSYEAVFAVTSKQYVSPETVILFADAAQTSTNKALLTLTGLTSGTGRASALYDRTAAAHAAWYKWRCWASLNGTPTIGNTIEYYIITSDGTRIDGELPITTSADGALTVEKRRNLQPPMILQIDQNASTVLMTTSTLVYIPDRYVAIGVWNTSGLPFEASPTKHGCNLIPMPPEQQ